MNNSTDKKQDENVSTSTGFQKKYIEQFKKYMEESPNKKLVIMAPTTEVKGFRIYSNGGQLAEIKKNKAIFLNSKYDKKYLGDIFTLDDINEFRKKFESLTDWDDKAYRDFKKGIDKCTTITEVWCKNESQSHHERKLENEIISYFRRNKKVLFVDMEFNAAKGKYGGITPYGRCKKKEFEDFRIRGGRVDLVVYDPENGFGLIELKYNNDSMDNIGKHFADFDAIVNGDNSDNIADELERRLNILIDLGIIKTTIKSKRLWYGFLLIGKIKDEYTNEIKKTSNWNCSESRDNTSYTVDWSDLMEAYKSGSVKNPGRYIWYSDYKDESFNLNFEDMEEFVF